MADVPLVAAYWAETEAARAAVMVNMENCMFAVLCVVGCLSVVFVVLY